MIAAAMRLQHSHAGTRRTVVPGGDAGWAVGSPWRRQRRSRRHGGRQGDTAADHSSTVTEHGASDTEPGSSVRRRVWGATASGCAGVLG
jgi:hypothetical protein